MMSHEDQLIREHRRRLAILELRIAQSGRTAQPEWINEADDLRIEIARLRIRRSAMRTIIPGVPWYIRHDTLIRALAVGIVILSLLAVTTIIAR
jgi:hypothetical protein